MNTQSEPVADSGSDKRHFSRIPFQADATLYSPVKDQSWSCALLDISLKGAKISRPLDWHGQYKDHLTLKIFLGEETTILMQAEVIHIGKNHIGMMNRYIDVDSATHLHRLIELNLGDSNMLRREYGELVSPAE